MAEERLQGCRVAVLATDGFEQVELETPVEALRQAGADVEVVAPHGGQIQGFNHHDKGRMVSVDRELANASPDQYDAIVLPGGVINPDELRLVPEAIAFIRSFADEGKPIAAICHGPWVLCSTPALKGKKATCFFAIKDDVINAGASYSDAEVVRDGNLITSRKPDDLPAFMQAIFQAVKEAKPAMAAAR
jgi:protease I